MKDSRIGEINYNNNGSKMKIIKYNNCHNIMVKFQDGYCTNTTYRNFQLRQVANPYDKTIFGIGFIGEGEYLICIDNKYFKHTKEYNAWYNMLLRCYNKKCQEKHPTYIGCTVCKEWYNFQNFAKWYNENCYEINGKRMELDKDILHKRNKIYSPENCIIVSNDINVLFTKRNALRGDYPIGVSLDSRCNRYMANYNYNGKLNHIGNYNTPEEAFYLGYKLYKEKLIKQIADEYKDKIPKKLYEAMYRYEVEITD